MSRHTDPHPSLPLPGRGYTGRFATPFLSPSPKGEGLGSGFCGARPFEQVQP